MIDAAITAFIGDDAPAQLKKDTFRHLSPF
jgi:hypothetical protein